MMDAGTGLLICGAGLWAVVGWTAHAWLSEWERSHKAVKLDAPVLSPYERTLKAFDDRIAEARAKHQKIKPIMDEKAAFVKAELECWAPLQQGLRDFSSQEIYPMLGCGPNPIDYQFDPNRPGQLLYQIGGIS